MLAIGGRMCFAAHMKIRGKKQHVTRFKRMVRLVATVGAVGTGALAMGTSTPGAFASPALAPMPAPAVSAPTMQDPAPDLPKSLSPPNINPSKKDPVYDPAARAAPQQTLEQAVTNPKVEVDVPAALQVARSQYGNAPSVIICVGPGNKAVFVIFIDLVDPTKPIANRSAACDRAVKGAHP